MEEYPTERQYPYGLLILEKQVRFEIAAIPPAMVEKVMLNFRERLHKCIENEGKHLDDILFRTTKPRN